MTTLPVTLEQLPDALDERTRKILAYRSARSTRQGRGWLMRRMLLAADLLGFGAAFAVAEAVVNGSSGRFGLLAESLVFTLALPIWVVMAKLYGLFARDEERADHSTADDLIGVFQLATIGTWLLVLAMPVAGISDPPITKVAIFWAIAVVAVPLLRVAARARCRSSIDYLQNALVVGAGDVGQEIARKLLKHPEYGINLVGFVDADGADYQAAAPGAHVRVLGRLEDVPALIDLLDVERVIVAFADYDVEELVAMTRHLNELRVRVDVVPRFYDVLSPASQIHSVEGLPLLGLRPATLSSSEYFLKRALDLAGALLGLVLLTPFLAAVALAIKVDSRGPVFFRQVRMGAKDRTFRIVKFRTMTADADRRKPSLAHMNKHALNGGDGRMFKIEDDPRVTRVGRWLRRVSIDELPQLWNVLRGDMSLVGPRPLILDEHAHVSDWGERRLDLRPGMTGLWQVLGRDDIPFEEMVKLDYLYITNWSLGGDIGLLLRTLPAIVRRGT